MTHGNGAAGDVQPLIGNAQLIPAVKDLAGEGLVQFPQIDVADLVAGTLQEARYRINRTDAHLVGLAAGDGEAAEYPQRLETPPLRQLAVHDHYGAAAVGKLTGIAGRDDPSRYGRANLRNGLERGVGTN